MPIYHVYFRDRMRSGREFVPADSPVGAKSAVEKAYPYCTVISVQRSSTKPTEKSEPAFRQELPSLDSLGQGPAWPG